MKLAEFQSAAPVRVITFGIELQDGRSTERACTFSTFAIPEEFASKRVRIEIHSVESEEEGRG